ncbi:hypothetical protein BH09ACT10_BH09ACT10_28240 [soil metagenome]
MINFRYHIVSLAAVLFALAGGIALGAGALHDDGNVAGFDTTSSEQVDPALASFDDAYAKRTAPILLAGQLAGQTVTIFTLPGAAGDQVDGVVNAINSAGGSVVNKVTLLPKLIDSSGRQFAEGVAQQSTSGVAGMPTDGDSYARIGAALARAFLAKDPVASDAAGATASSAFVQGKLIEVDGALTKRGSLALVIAGASEPDSDEGQADIVQALASAFDTASKGAVVAGPSASSSTGGFLQVIRSGPVAATVSTVDVLETPGGRNVVALVLAKEKAGASGAFGTSRSSNGPLPAG